MVKTDKKSILQYFYKYIYTHIYIYLVSHRGREGKRQKAVTASL